MARVSLALVARPRVRNMGEASSNLTAQRACTLGSPPPPPRESGFSSHRCCGPPTGSARGMQRSLVHYVFTVFTGQAEPMCHVIDKLLTAPLAPAAPLARVPVRVLSGLFTCPSCKDTAQPCSHHDQSPREVQFVHQTAECAPALAIKHTMAFLDNHALVRFFSSVHQPDECIGGHLLGSGAKTQAQALIRLRKPEHLPLGKADQTCALDGMA